MNEEDFLKKIIYDLLMRGRRPLVETKEFTGRKHNDDLVPAFNRKLNNILNIFDRYRRASHDIQGLKDHGVDVLLRYELDQQKQYIGFQLKSYDDLNEKNWLKTIKAAVFDTQGHYSEQTLVDFYILLCTDALEHADKVRMVTGDLVKNESFTVHIVPPENALAFFKVTDTLVGAYIKNRFSEDDIVLREARESLNGHSLGEAAMIIEAMVEAYFSRADLQPERILESFFVDKIYEEYPALPISYYEASVEEQKSWELIEMDPADEIQNIIWDDRFFSHDTHSEYFIFNVESNLSLVALAFDAKARHGFSDGDVKDYLFTVLMEDKIEQAEEFAARNMASVSKRKIKN